MTIREYAKSVGFEIVGKLTRRPEWEYTRDGFTGEIKHSGCKHYADEGGNEYISGKTAFALSPLTTQLFNKTGGKTS